MGPNRLIPVSPARLAAVDSIPWVIGFGLLGRAVGANWEKWCEHLSILDYLTVAAIAVGIVYWLHKRRQGGDGDGGEAEPAREPAAAPGA